MFVYQLPGISQCRLADVASAEHLGDFFHPLFRSQFPHLRDGSGLGFLLHHLIMMAAHGCYLRQVGDGDDLTVQVAHLGHDSRQSFR